MSGTTISGPLASLYLQSAAQNPVTITPTGSVINTSGNGAAISANRSNVWTLSNYGTIVGRGNYGTIAATGTAGYQAVFLGGGGSVLNNGLTRRSRSPAKPRR